MLTDRCKKNSTARQKPRRLQRGGNSSQTGLTKQGGRKGFRGAAHPGYLKERAGGEKNRVGQKPEGSLRPQNRKERTKKKKCRGGKPAVRGKKRQKEVIWNNGDGKDLVKAI